MVTPEQIERIAQAWFHWQGNGWCDWYGLPPETRERFLKRMTYAVEQGLRKGASNA